MSRYGCYLCGSREHPILTSRFNPFVNGSVALFPPCDREYEKKGPVSLAPNAPRPKQSSAPPR